MLPMFETVTYVSDDLQFKIDAVSTHPSIEVNAGRARIRQFCTLEQLTTLRDQINAALTKLQPASETKNQEG